MAKDRLKEAVTNWVISNVHNPSLIDSCRYVLENNDVFDRLLVYLDEQQISHSVEEIDKILFGFVDLGM